MSMITNGMVTIMTETKTTQAQAAIERARQWDLEAEIELVRASKLRVELYLVDPPVAEGSPSDLDTLCTDNEVSDVLRAIGTQERDDPFDVLFAVTPANVDALEYQLEVLGEHGVRVDWHGSPRLSSWVLSTARAARQGVWWPTIEFPSVTATL